MSGLTEPVRVSSEAAHDEYIDSNDQQQQPVNRTPRPINYFDDDSRGVAR